jgi:hypothetical protein
VREGVDRVREGVEAGYAKAEDMVHSKPAESVLFAFGCGVAVGVGLTLILGHDRPREGFWSRSGEATDSLARRIVDAIAARTA